MLNNMIDNKEEYYYHGSYLKAVYKCDDCNFTLTTVGGEKEIEVCSFCGKLIKRELVPLEFCQSYDYATAISC
jgi:hypothetical protein